MGRETFEDKVRNKFEGQTRKAPGSLWNQIEHSLNADLVETYQSQQSFYKWLSIAALLIATLLLGVLLALPFDLQTNEEISDASTSDGDVFYNALLSKNLNYNNYYKAYFSGDLDRDLSFSTIDHTSKTSPDQVTVIEEDTAYDILQLSGKRPSPKLANTHSEVYQYYTLGSFFSKKKEKTLNKSKLWAGVEAGAGTFENDLNSTTLSNSLNPAGLANAIGSGNFVNPTTNISQEMGQALATSVALDLGVQLGERWTLESGIAYTNFSNNGTAAINVLDVFTIENTNFESGGLVSVEDDDFVNPSISSREATLEVERSFDHEVELNNRLQFASIPLKAGYFVVDKKFKLRLNAGLSANYLVDGNISDPTDQIVNSDELGIYNDWSFDGVGGMELGYSIFKQFDLTIEPNYRHAITPLSSATNDVSRFALLTGLRYTIK